MQLNLAMVGTAALMLAVPAQAADRYDDPKALVSAIYASYQPGALSPSPTVFYSRHLRAIFDQSVENKVFADHAATAGKEFTAAELFNPFMPDASALLFDVVIGEPVMLGDRAIVNVSYHNFDHPRLLAIATVREAEGWKVDDVAAMGSDEHWLLSWALTYDPLGF